MKTFPFVASAWSTADQEFYVHPLIETSQNLDMMNEELRPVAAKDTDTAMI